MVEGQKIPMTCGIYLFHIGDNDDDLITITRFWLLLVIKQIASTKQLQQSKSNPLQELTKEALFFSAFQFAKCSDFFFIRKIEMTNEIGS